MRISLLLLVACFGLSGVVSGQEQTAATDPSPPSLREQFDELISRSNSYQDFWVIKKNAIQDLQKTIQDSLNVQAGSKRKAESELQQVQTRLNKTEELLEAAEQRSTELDKAKDSINLFGLPLNKALYQTIVYATLGILLALLVIVSLRYQSRSGATGKVEKALRDTQEEFDQYKKRAIEREQKLKRELQDELNKRS